MGSPMTTNHDLEADGRKGGRKSVFFFRQLPVVLTFERVPRRGAPLRELYPAVQRGVFVDRSANEARAEQFGGVAGLAVVVRDGHL